MDVPVAVVAGGDFFKRLLHANEAHSVLHDVVGVQIQRGGVAGQLQAEKFQLPMRVDAETAACRIDQPVQDVAQRLRFIVRNPVPANQVVAGKGRDGCQS